MLSVGAATYWLNNPPPVEPLRLRRIPMLAAALCFATGITLARQWHPPALLITVTALLLLLCFVALRHVQRFAAMPVFALWIAIGCWYAQMQPPIAQQYGLRTYADGLSRTVEGRVLRVRTLTHSMGGRRRS